MFSSPAESLLTGNTIHLVNLLKSGHYLTNAQVPYRLK